MKTRNYEIFDRYGNRVERDGQLLDGDVLRVPLHLRDGMSEAQQWVMADKAARLSPVVDATGGTAGLTRPGPRYARDQAAHDAREQAYRDSKRELQDAWRTPVAAPPSIEPRATMTDAPRTMTMDEAQRIRDRAWLESVKDLELAWKGPAR